MTTQCALSPGKSIRSWTSGSPDWAPDHPVEVPPAGGRRRVESRADWHWSVPDDRVCQRRPHLLRGARAYFGGAPAAKPVTVKQIGETAARIAAMLNGEIDLMTNLPPDQI